MKKTVFVLATVCALIALLIVPCFAAETTVDRGDPVDWFGGQTVGSYSVSFDQSVSVNTSSPDNLVSFISWLTAIGAVSDSSAVGTVNITTSSPVDYDSVKIYTDGSRVKFYGQGTGGYVATIRGGSVSVSSASGYDSALTLPSSSVTPVMVGSEGFVDSGFSTALTELSTIVSAILSNQYILIAIGLAVAVPLVAWGISKIKSLVKGY